MMYATPPPPSLQIPAHIPKPDYHRDGIPRKEIESRQQTISECMRRHGMNRAAGPCQFLDA